MQISFDTENLTEADKAVIALATGLAFPLSAENAVATKSVPKKAAAAKPAPESEPEDDDLLGGDDAASDDEPTMEDAVAAATKLVSEGKAAEVKAALAKVGAKRVSEVTEANIAKFVKALG